jgi:hypothetical protein
MIRITNSTTACFIEREKLISRRDKDTIEYLLKNVLSECSSQDLTYKNYIKMEVASALENENAVWNAIQKSEHIWCESYFEGKSAQLCSKMLHLAKETGLKDKVFFDLAGRTRALHNLFAFDIEAGYLIENLAINNNLNFYFMEEILAIKLDSNHMEVVCELPYKVSGCWL